MHEIELGLSLVAVRTPTLPPATHTNSWVIGTSALTVVDPASPWEDEQQRLFQALQQRMGQGARVERLFLTHHHLDHVSGAADLRRRLADIGVAVPIAAHPITADLVRSRIDVDELVNDGDEVAGTVAYHTPGHAPGHLVLHHRAAGWMVAGDMVAGIGTIAIDPDEGDLGHYLASLERMRTLGADRLLPAHGPVMPHAEAVISFYTAHRHHRSEQIRVALDHAGSATPLELVPVVYPDLDPRMYPVAAAQILTHLKWLQPHGLARAGATDRWTT